MENPEYISVIIIAHDRKEFILSAVESVLRQTVNRQKYEIIVVKNFNDSKIDQYLLNMKIKNIFTDSKNLGAKCSIGVENAKGTIVSFLEDDDLYLDNKLNRVIMKFKDGRIAYYHNLHQAIKQDGSFLKITDFKIPKTEHLLGLNGITYTNMGRILREGGFFNLSCISVRRDIITPYLKDLKELSIAVDNFMFYVSLSSGGVLYLDNMILTKYLIHSSNDSINLETNREYALSKAISFLQRDIVGYEKIQALTNDCFIKEVIACRMWAPKINLYLLDDSYKKPSKSDFFQAMKYSLRFRYKALFLLSIMAIIFGHFKKLNTFFYILHVKRKIKKFAKRSKTTPT